MLDPTIKVYLPSEPAPPPVEIFTVHVFDNIDEVNIQDIRTRRPHGRDVFDDELFALNSTELRALIDGLEESYSRLRDAGF